jgi:hypothetical protein
MLDEVRMLEQFDVKNKRSDGNRSLSQLAGTSLREFPC